MTAPTVSVVITTRNEERNIPNVVAACKEQTYAVSEIIVIDNHSADRTCEIADELGAIVRTYGPERSAQRNYGIIHVATGDVVLFLDADMTPTASVVEMCVKTLTPDVIALHIDEYILGSSIFARIRRFERSFYSGTSIDGVRCFRRKDFISVGGFDEALPPGPEDWDLDLRFAQAGVLTTVTNHGGQVGPTATLIATATSSKVPTDYVGVLHNESRLTVGEYVQKKRYYTPGLRAYSSKWGQDHPVVKKQLSPTYRLFTVFLEHGKYRTIFRHPLLTIGMMTLRAVIAMMFLCNRR